MVKKNEVRFKQQKSLLFTGTSLEIDSFDDFRLRVGDGLDQKQIPSGSGVRKNKNKNSF
jgi:hypothetical protein